MPPMGAREGGSAPSFRGVPSRVVGTEGGASAHRPARRNL